MTQTDDAFFARQPELFHSDGTPKAQGLYDPAYEHDNCGVGFVAHIKGQRSRQIIDDSLRILRHMTHRGACGCEPNTGDGAGILTALPHEFMQLLAQRDLKISLPEPGRYGVGLVFLPTDPEQRSMYREQVNQLVKEQGQTLLGWRKVPVTPDDADIGPSARAAMPAFEQLFVGAAEGLSQEAFDRQLFVIRKRASHQIREGSLPQALKFYICSLSSRVLIYKGMLTPEQVPNFYPDLQQPEYTSHLAMVHSRFSTNTFPSWDRAHPQRYMAHNGEINTVRGNSNWMFARQGVMKSELFGDDLAKLFPVVEPHCSDSGNFDNALELLLMSGRSLPEAMMMMVPEAWQNHESMPEDKRAFYEYHSALQEPWDGPASISFTDGNCIGATLDRNGLRPSRYYVTHDDRVIMASEVGVLDIAPENVKLKGRLQPGKMFLVDFEQGRLIPDEELKREFANRRPYGQWLKNQRLLLNDLPAADPPARMAGDDLLRHLQSFGYTTETLQFMLVPMITTKKDPLGSMGDDSALACMSDQPRPLSDYFKQLFAQVTNPAIDSTREEVIMSLECYIGPEGNILETTEAQCHRLVVPHPILTNEELASLKHLDSRGWRTKAIDTTYPKSQGTKGLKPALERICAEARQAIADGYSLVILSDRAACPDRLPVSSLLATGAVHHHLVKHEERTRIGIVVETGEAREVHQFCCLVGYGADAINPYLAFEALWHLQDDGELPGDWTHDEITAAYRKATKQGILKVMAKMGISTLQSYKGGQIFEAVGLSEDVVSMCFRGTASRIKGVNFEILAEEALRRHELGYPTREDHRLPVLPNFGLFAWRATGEKHAWNPLSIAHIQKAARQGDKASYAEFSKLINEQVSRECHLRGLLRFKSGKPVPIEEVEPAKEIVKRFCTGAMSYGSISAEAHETIAVAMNRIGGKSNTGEGGEDYKRFTPMPNGDSKRSAIKQVASGRFGVTSWYLTNADELQIKISQGAKPG
ncbi:MAG TPA: glutamate synthase central domain-containing protein, partial [Planctomycetaceae bacterium]|nr:glutamate synthase central domain-containing protein [Planctomycetaceae bacterium]